MEEEVVTLKCKHIFHHQCLVKQLVAAPTDQPSPPSRELYRNDDDPAVEKALCPACVDCDRLTVSFTRPVAHVRISPEKLRARVDLEENEVTPVRLLYLMTNPRWFNDHLYYTFETAVRAQPTFQVPSNPPAGNEIWRGITTIQAGAIRVRKPGRPSRIAFLQPEERYHVVCWIAALRKRSPTGTLLRRCLSLGKFTACVDIAALREQYSGGAVPLYEVVRHAVHHTVHHITQLDFEELYPDRRFVQRYLVPHIAIGYDRSVAEVAFRLGEWPAGFFRDVFEVCPQGDIEQRGADLVESLGGLTPPGHPDPTYLMTTAFPRESVEQLYDAQATLYDMPPIVDGKKKRYAGIEYVPLRRSASDG